MASGGHPHLPPHPHPHPHVHHDTSNPNSNPVAPSSIPVPASNNNNPSSAPANNSSSSASVSQSSNTSTPHNSVGSAAANNNNNCNVVIPTPIAAAAQIPAHARLMCSYGGRILPRPGDHQLRYVGGETRIFSFPRTASFATLLSLLSSLAPSQFSPKSPAAVKYQLPNEDLDSLISLCSDDDLVNMLDELDRLSSGSKAFRIRLFLFPSSSSSSAAAQGGGGGGAFGSVLSTGESNQWFLDALNSASPTAVGQALERRRSEASSSMLSDQPDYLTGIDTGSERSPVNIDADPTDPTEPTDPPEPSLLPPPQESSPVQPPPPPPVYYMPQPMPMYYLSTPVQYMPPSLEGRGYVPMPMPVPRPVYYSKENEQYVGVGVSTMGGYLYEQAPVGTGYVRAPLSMYPNPQMDAGMK